MSCASATRDWSLPLPAASLPPCSHPPTKRVGDSTSEVTPRRVRVLPARSRDRFAAGEGGLGYCRTWRSTANGLEAVAELHNDSLLVVDELSELDPREAGDTAYMLSNGAGKARISRTSVLKKVGVLAPARFIEWGNFPSGSHSRGGEACQGRTPDPPDRYSCRRGCGPWDLRGSSWRAGCG